MKPALAYALILLSLVVLEHARWRIQITSDTIANTPVTRYALTEVDGPTVVIAHGFAGSQQMMQGFALPLARAGYDVFAFDFLGHGRHPAPMSGDVNSIDGTTKLLVRQTQQVLDAVAPPGKPVALLGHSMATDILVRAAQGRSDIGPMVLVSAFSQAITAQTPQNLLLISGAWEPGLRGFGLRAAQMVSPDATEGTTVSRDDVTRRAIAAPFSEHVAVLHSRTARSEALIWLDRAFQRHSDVVILPTGWGLMGLLSGLVLLFPTLARRVPAAGAAISDTTGPELSWRKRLLICLAPAVIAPLIAVPLNPGFLPVLVADYLGLHLLIFGVLQLALLYHWRLLSPAVSWPMVALLLVWSALFGIALNRYGANFWPTPERLWIIAILCLGALPYMAADAHLTHRASWPARLVLRLSFLASLGIAVALDFQALFFLIMIAPVLVLFYLVFGSMGRATAHHNAPLGAGLALGLVLAWALGVSFPLFQP
ncbi:MAG: alpha/beta hydrolase [Sedimentitalea sp.]